MQQPTRDRPAQTGKATISGVVMSDETPSKPLRRVRVTLNSPELPRGRTEITNDDGTFVFQQLPAGRYHVGATKEAYLFVNYGATRAGRPGTPVVVREGDSRQLTLRMPRGSVITGMVAMKDSQPAAGVQVVALASNYVAGVGERRPVPAGAATSITDDRGVYRIFGLPPGDYVVAAMQQRSPVMPGELRRLTEAEIRRALADVREVAGATRSTPGFSTTRGAKPSPLPPPARPVAYAPVLYPGTTNPALAMTVTLGRAEERTGIDVVLDPVPTARIEGRVFAPGATMPAGTQVVIIPSSAIPAIAGGFRGSAPVQPDGSFAIRAVPPGRYVVTAVSTIRPSVPGQRATTLAGSADVSVDGEDIGNVMLSLEPGVTISGSVSFEGTRPAPPLGGLKIALPSLSLSNGTFGVAPSNVALDADGRFTLGGIHKGVYRLGATIPGVRTPLGPWWLKSIAIDGRELLDAPLEFRESTDRAVVTFSDRASSLTGVAVDKERTPVPDTYVVVFSADRRSWFHNSRRVAGVKTDANGRYSVRNLPPGDYFVIATTDVEPGEWFDPVFLERHATGAVRFSVREYEDVSQDAMIR